jgi:hypothetical protein
MHWYPSFTESFVLYELPIMRGMAYHAASMESDGWLQFAGMQRASPAYIAQEVEKYMKQVR